MQERIERGFNFSTRLRGCRSIFVHDAIHIPRIKGDIAFACGFGEHQAHVGECFADGFVGVDVSALHDGV